MGECFAAILRSGSNKPSRIDGNSASRPNGRKMPAPPRALAHDRTFRSSETPPGLWPNISCASPPTRAEGNSFSLLAGRAPRAITTPPCRTKRARFLHARIGKVSAPGRMTTCQRSLPWTSAPCLTLASASARLSTNVKSRCELKSSSAAVRYTLSMRVAVLATSRVHSREGVKLTQRLSAGYSTATSATCCPPRKAVQHRPIYSLRRRNWLSDSPA